MFDLFIETYSSMLSFQWCLAWCSPGSDIALVLQNLVGFSIFFSVCLVWVFLCFGYCCFFGVCLVCWLVVFCWVFLNNNMF